MVPRAESLHRFSKYLVATRPSSSPPVPFPGQPHPSDLNALSSHDASNALSREDMKDLLQLHDDLRAIFKKAKERGVRIIMDAEYT